MATLSLLWMWQVTSPAEVGLLGVLVVFILLYLSVLGALTFLLVGANKCIVGLASRTVARHPVSQMSLRRAYYFSSVLALGPVMIIGMQSVGETGIYELSLVTFFLVIACVYIAKRTG